MTNKDEKSPPPPPSVETFPSTIYTSSSKVGASPLTTTSRRKMLSRPASARSTSSGVSTGTTSSQVLSTLKMERDLLERMVQERDEKIKAMQQRIDMQKEHINGLQVKNDKEKERQRQEATRQKIALQSVKQEKKLLQNQLKVLQKENLRIKNDPIHRALTKNPTPSAPPFEAFASSIKNAASSLKGGVGAAGGGGAGATKAEVQELSSKSRPPAVIPDKSLSPENDNAVDSPPPDGESTSIDETASMDTDDANTNSKASTDAAATPPPPAPASVAREEIKILDNDQRCLVLQSQLYQAMNSLSSLQQQATTLKQNYDEIVSGLQKELIEAEDAKAKTEVKLLSRMTVLEREKNIIQELLQEKLRARDTRIRRLEKRIQNLDSINDDESLDDDNDDGDKDGRGAIFHVTTNTDEFDSVVGINGDVDDEDNSSGITESISNTNLKGNSESASRHEGIKGLLSELEMLSAHSSQRKLFSNGND